jgi:hypothetical protein
MRLLLLWTIIVVSVGAIIFSIGVGLVYAGVSPLGTPMVEVGSTLIGSGIVGIVLAKASATISGEVQEGIDARKEHKREIDQFVDGLTRSNRTVSVAGDGGMNFLVGYLTVVRSIIRNLGDIQSNPEQRLLWEDIHEHWPKTKSKADNLVLEVNTHNRDVRKFVDSWNDKVRLRIDNFGLDGKPADEQNAHGWMNSALNNRFTYATSKISAFGPYVFGHDSVRGTLQVPPEEVKAMGGLAGLDTLTAVIESYRGMNLDQVPENIREFVGLGKDDLERKYYGALTKFLATAISELIDELKRDSTRKSLYDSRIRLDAEIGMVEAAFLKIKMSKSLPGQCEYVRVGS